MGEELKKKALRGDLSKVKEDRKREEEQYAAFKERIKSISSGKFASARTSILMSATSTLSSAYNKGTSIPSYVIENAPFSLTPNERHHYNTQENPYNIVCCTNYGLCS